MINDIFMMAKNELLLKNMKFLLAKKYIQITNPIIKNY